MRPGGVKAGLPVVYANTWFPNSSMGTRMLAALLRAQEVTFASLTCVKQSFSMARSQAGAWERRKRGDVLDANSSEYRRDVSLVAAMDSCIDSVGLGWFADRPFERVIPIPATEVTVCGAPFDAVVVGSRFGE